MVLLGCTLQSEVCTPIIVVRAAEVPGQLNHDDYQGKQEKRGGGGGG